MLYRLRFMLWRKEENMGIAWISFGSLDHSQATKWLNRHWMTHCCEKYVDKTNHRYIVCNILLGKKDCFMGKLRLRHHVGLLVNRHISLKVRHFVYVELVRSWREVVLFWMGSINSHEQCNSLRKRLLVSFYLLYWQGEETLRSQFNYLCVLEVVDVCSVINT